MEILGQTIAAAIAATFAIWFYFRQKEYELIQQRYLVEGIDVVISEAEEAMNCFHFNWARCLEVLKAYRDLPKFDCSDLRVGFVDLPKSRFPLTAIHRVTTMTKSHVVWDAFQLTMSFAQTATSVVKDEIPTAIRVQVEDKLDDTKRDELLEEAGEKIKELNGAAADYHHFISQLRQIAAIVEQQRFNAKAIRRLGEKTNVEEILREIHNRFRDRATVAEQAYQASLDRSTP